MKQAGSWALAVALCIVPASQAQAFEFSDITRVFTEPFEDFDSSVIIEPLEVGVDAVIVRPLTISTLVVGAILLVPALALSAAEGQESWDDAIELFITIPYEDAFQRELGDF